MRNYMILNGQSSEDITGLIIQELAPISKPLMRTQVEEIDGRDGDIITKLGYSAYNKQISIGLYGDYDIDEIIAYFNSEGTVIFSNEPDKYYYYEIVNQIDFERLVRFRTATVTMHCQPFKYATDESAKTFNITSGITKIAVTNNGNIYSKPTLTIYGTGTVNLSLNGNQIFVIHLGETANYLTIDTNLMEAYKDSIATLMNRSVDGDYNNFKLKVGSNSITWGGNLSKIVIENYSRWL